MSVPVSIIIPVYDDWERLKLCLNALNTQSYSKDNFEIIVVNNSPSSKPILDTKAFPNVLLIDEARPGSYAARNAGLRIAQGEVIGFTDSDCIPDTDWIANAIAHLKSNPTCSRVAGEIKVIQKSHKPTVIEVYNQLYSFPQKSVIEFHGGSMTANLFTYRNVLNTVGGFNENFFSYGDMEWGRRANNAGFRVDYVENVIVYHPIRDLHALITKEKRLGGGVARYYERNRHRLLDIARFFYQFRPRLGAFKLVMSNRHQLSWQHLVLIPFLRYYFGLVREFERFRVILGKTPNRY